MTDKIYGALNGATVFALNDQAGYDQAVADGVGDRWREVPEGTVPGSSVAIEDGAEVWAHPDTTPARLRVVDRQTFFASFTAFEEVDIRDFVVARPEGETQDQVRLRKAVGVMLGRLESADRVDLELPSTIAGMGLLVACGLITLERSAQTLAGPLA